jgi:hypothetical protein
VSSVKYELGFYIPEDDILHSHSRENLKSYLQKQFRKRKLKIRMRQNICDWTDRQTDRQADRQNWSQLPLFHLSFNHMTGTSRRSTNPRNKSTVTTQLPGPDWLTTQRFVHPRPSNGIINLSTAALRIVTCLEATSYRKLFSALPEG